MEATTRLRPRLRRELRAEQELARLRPFGEAYLMRNFGERLAFADAEDAVSDVTLRLHRQLATGRPPRNLQAAFLTGCRNAAIDRLRRRARKPTVALEAAAESPAEEPSPDQHAEHRETAARTREVLARLRPRHRKALMLRFGAGMTVPEVAAQMQLSLPAAKNLIARAIEQARRRFEAIEERQFCPEIHDLLRGAVVDHELAGIAEADGRRALEAHLEHCGGCKSFLADLHRNLNELGSGALIAAGLARHPGPLAHLARWFDQALQTFHSGSDKARLSAYKFGGAFNGDAGAGGALAGTTQKALAVCGAATTATCLATGLVGPGIGALDHQRSDPVAHFQHHRPASADRLVEPQPTPEQLEPQSGALPEAAPTPASEPEPAAEPEPEPEPTPTPAQQSAEEFGVESTAPPPESEPAPQPAPASSLPARTSSGTGGSSGSESFGFGG